MTIRPRAPEPAQLAGTSASQAARSEKRNGGRFVVELIAALVAVFGGGQQPPPASFAPQPQPDEPRRPEDTGGAKAGRPLSAQSQPSARRLKAGALIHGEGAPNGTAGGQQVAEQKTRGLLVGASPGLSASTEETSAQPAAGQLDTQGQGRVPIVSSLPSLTQQAETRASTKRLKAARQPARRLRKPATPTEGSLPETRPRARATVSGQELHSVVLEAKQSIETTSEGRPKRPEGAQQDGVVSAEASGLAERASSLHAGARPIVPAGDGQYKEAVETVETLFDRLVEHSRVTRRHETTTWRLRLVEPRLGPFNVELRWQGDSLYATFRGRGEQAAPLQAHVLEPLRGQLLDVGIDVGWVAWNGETGGRRGSRRERGSEASGEIVRNQTVEVSSESAVGTRRQDNRSALDVLA